MGIYEQYASEPALEFSVDSVLSARFYFKNKLTYIPVQRGRTAVSRQHLKVLEAQRSLLGNFGDFLRRYPVQREFLGPRHVSIEGQLFLLIFLRSQRPGQRSKIELDDVVQRHRPFHSEIVIVENQQGTIEGTSAVACGSEVTQVI